MVERVEKVMSGTAEGRRALGGERVCEECSHAIVFDDVDGVWVHVHCDGDEGCCNAVGGCGCVEAKGGAQGVPLSVLPGVERPKEVRCDEVVVGGVRRVLQSFREHKVSAHEAITALRVVRGGAGWSFPYASAVLVGCAGFEAEVVMLFGVIIDER